MWNKMLVMVVAAGMFVGCVSEPEQSGPEPDAVESGIVMPSEATPPETIVAARGGFVPEGVEYDTTNNRFLTGSLSEGSVFEIHNDGLVTTVVSDPDLVSSVGIEVDELNDRLLVANADRSVFEGASAGQAKLGVYNLTTGERIVMVDLAAAIMDAPADAAYFANDVAVADDGTAYVTDTRMSALYRVSPDYEVSVLHRFDGFGPNGIVHHPSGYLLVCGGSDLWKVPVDDPAGASRVTLSEEIDGQDGMVWMSDGRLAIVSNSESRVVTLTSEDDWGTAQRVAVAPYETQATTGAVVGDHIYVVHPHFADQDPPSLERVTFR
jgi:sugar lactone lactonase YvrE